MTDLSTIEEVEAGTNRINMSETAPAEVSGKSSGSTSESCSLRSSRHSSKSSGKSSRPRINVPVDRATLELAITEHNRDDEEYDEEEAISKNRSRLFLFACCDIRMGSIAMNAANIVVMLLVNFLLIPNRKDMDETMDFTEEMREKRENAWFVTNLRNYLAIAVSLLLGIPGAWKFQKHLVGLATILFFALAVWGFVIGRHLGAFGNVVMIYPNGHLFWALLTSTLTRENYPTHKRWCW